MKKHANIPVFIPHEGCPNACVFRNQRVITGVKAAADRDIRPEIDAALASILLPPTDVQIAFFGGSFTGIDRTLMVRLLCDAYAYVRAGAPMQLGHRLNMVEVAVRQQYVSQAAALCLARLDYLVRRTAGVGHERLARVLYAHHMRVFGHGVSDYRLYYDLHVKTLSSSRAVS